jgi:hypothetical protein
MSAHANIGDTMTQSERRYGDPVGHNKVGNPYFNHHGWQIVE